MIEEIAQRNNENPHRVISEGRVGFKLNEPQEITQGTKDTMMNRKKMDKGFLDALDLEKSMDEILELTEVFKYDLMKAKRDHEKSGKYTVSCLFRVRQLLIDLEKLGSQFRKLSIAYEKDLEKKKKPKGAKK